MNNFIRALWNKSFKNQLIYGLVVNLSIVIIVLRFIDVKTHNDYLRERAVNHATELSTSLALSSKVWMMSKDYEGLDQVVRHFAAYKDMVYAMIIGMDGQVVAHTDSSKTGQYIADKKRKAYLEKLSLNPQAGDLISKIFENDDFINVVKPVRNNHTILGFVDIHLDQRSIKKNIENEIWKGVFFSIVYLFFAILISYFIVSRLTKKLSELIDTMKKVREGGKDIRANEDGVSELVQLSSEFNRMLDAIKQSEKANIQLKERLEFALQGSNDGIWDWNLNTNDVYLSSQWKEMLGYKDSELDNAFSTWEALAHKDDLQATKDEIQAYVEGHTPVFENIHRMRHKDGHWVWILARGKIFSSDNGSVRRFIGTHTDITKQKNSEIHLNEALTLQTAIFDNINYMIIVTDIQGLIKKFNKEAEKILGYKAKEVIGLKTPSLFHDKEEMIERAKAFSKELGETIKPEFNLLVVKTNRGLSNIQEWTYISKAGKRIPMISSVTALRNAMGDITGYIGVIEDITQRKKSEQELKEQKAIMLFQSRNAQMGEMLSMIAHQWRQPLGAISATIAMLQTKEALGKYNAQDYDDSFNKMTNLVLHLSKTIEDFSGFFKKDKHKAETTLKAVVESSIEILMPTLKTKDITLTTSYEDQEMIKTYPNELKQVILNLINNAQEMIDENEIKNGEIEVKTYADAKNYYIAVRDNAGGVPTVIMDKIFDPYFSTKTKLNGSGLGLYMSKKIITEHCDGNIEVTNINGGAEFIVSINK